MKTVFPASHPNAPRRKRGNARGFTLIEVILTCAVLAIFSGALALVMSAMQLSYVNSIETSYNRILANNVADAVKRQLSLAQIIEFDPATSITYVNEYGQQSIALNTTNPQIAGLTYDPNFYVGKEVQLKLEQDETKQSFTVTVSVKTLHGAAEGKLYELKRSFQKLNASTAP